ncbi:hypothetical protein N7U66_18845 [Lacinutrix neustonica]|uniref:Uncharacterized protein n=1 Tax=Lacinutrix neustonica TaxID=2980107 RepID=A0A9E8SDL8_9FLAO|nr:hypothetical protein [Lacinutrix neustonica]WAC01892.1 hypothetical protein N7U66_18845 [Lacinutrix neustonica]
MEYLSDFVPDVIFNSSLVYINLETNSITCWEEIYGTSQGTGWQDIVGWEQTPCPWHTSNSGGGETSSSPSRSGSDTTSEIPSAIVAKL